MRCRGLLRPCRSPTRSSSSKALMSTRRFVVLWESFLWLLFIYLAFVHFRWNSFQRLSLRRKSLPLESRGEGRRASREPSRIWVAFKMPPCLVRLSTRSSQESRQWSLLPSLPVPLVTCLLLILFFQLWIVRERIAHDIACNWCCGGQWRFEP